MTTHALHFAAAIARGDRATKRCLAAALDLHTLTIDSLTDAGIARYDALPLIQHLTQAGEVENGQWREDARNGYRQLLTPNPSSLQARDADERPRERALNQGIDALSDSELLALILRTGSGNEDVLSLARRLLREHDGLLGLANADIELLMAGHGVGPAKAAELSAAFELGRRLATAARGERPVLRDPEAVMDYCGPLMSALPHEEFWCLPLDPRSRLIGRPRTISQGDVDGTDAGPRAFFRSCLQCGATSAIALHNHPTGDPSPSQADRHVTKALAAAGKLLDIELVDHLIIGDGGRYTSLRRTNPSLFAS